MSPSCLTDPILKLWQKRPMAYKGDYISHAKSPAKVTSKAASVKGQPLRCSFKSFLYLREM